MRKILIFCAVVTIVLAVSGLAQAVTIEELKYYEHTLLAGDKIFTYHDSYNLPLDSTVSFDVSGQLAILTVNFDVDGMLTDNVYLFYTISINTSWSPLDVFKTVRTVTTLYDNGFPGWPTMTTTIFEPDPDLTLTSYNGNQSEVVTIPDHLTFLTVEDRYSGNGWLASEKTIFKEVTLPEPATICLLGLGGLALLRKRRA